MQLVTLPFRPRHKLCDTRHDFPATRESGWWFGVAPSAERDVSRVVRSVWSVCDRRSRGPRAVSGRWPSAKRCGGETRLAALGLPSPVSADANAALRRRSAVGRSWATSPVSADVSAVLRRRQSAIGAHGSCSRGWCSPGWRHCHGGVRRGSHEGAKARAGAFGMIQGMSAVGLGKRAGAERTPAGQVPAEPLPVGRHTRPGGMRCRSGVPPLLRAASGTSHERGAAPAGAKPL